MDDFNFKKSLGQNFLKDKNIVSKIVDTVNFEGNSLVIEIGPGAGSLTEKLLEKANFALIYEIDTRLKETLDDRLGNFSNYELIFDDFLKRNVKEDLKKYKYDNLYVVANLPYYITTPIITKFIEENVDVKEMVIMVQKEVADRLSAKVGVREYGQLTVFLNYFFDVQKVFNVNKAAFVPKPKVDSAVVRMTRKDNREHVKSLTFFSKLVKDSFRFKRKTIKNNLINYDLDKINEVLSKYGFDINTRSECLPYIVFVDMANSLME